MNEVHYQWYYCQSKIPVVILLVHKSQHNQLGLVKKSISLTVFALLFLLSVELIMYMLEVSKFEVNTVKQQLYNEIASKFTISKNIIHCIIEQVAIKVM